MNATPPPAGDLNRPWRHFDHPQAAAEFGLSDFLYSGGVTVFGSVLTLGDMSIPAVVFRFAKADGSGFYSPVALVAAPDELRALATLVDQATAAALVAVSGDGR